MFRQITKEELKVPAHTDYLADLRDFVTRIGRKHGFSDKVINAFKLAIDEAGTNIMRHAYREQGNEGYILIRALVKANSLTICLIDQGKYFDPNRVKNPDLERYVQIGKKGGLGIFIMRKLMDEIDYRKTLEGNELRLTKLRDKPARRGFRAPLASAVKAIPFSLKAKYWLRTSAILISVIALSYSYYFFKVESTERRAFFTTLRTLDRQINQSLAENSDLLTDITGINLAVALRSLFEGQRELLYEIALVNPAGEIIGHNDYELLFAKFREPASPPKQIDDKIFFYELEISPADDHSRVVGLYDVTTVLPPSDEVPEELTLHIRAYKSFVDRRISRARWAAGRLALTVALISCAGSFLLIYLLMNPLRKLTEYVRRADHGEIGDEMDIDTSSEIGEIAQAFSDITSKFRESQKNLAEQERLQKEMQVAQEIQQTLLPADFPEVEGFEIASHYEAAREVGGDYFDFVEVDKDTLGVVVADVSGKGVPGSLVMTMIRTALRTEARGTRDAAEVLAKVNNFVIGDIKKGMFVTLFYLMIDSKRRRVNYASAGHNPMILYRPSTKKTYYLNPRGFPVGIQLPEPDLFRKSIESDTIQLAEDDVLLIYTDGITEAMNTRRELFGEERFLKIIREYGHLRVKPFVEKIKDEIFSFTEGTAQSDDITLVSVKEKSTPEKEELRRAKQAHGLIGAGKSIREACELAGLTTYAYYNKYKKEFESKGIENIEVDNEISVEAKHISIEDKAKIFDIIKNHPEYGAKRISEELNTEKYGFTQIPDGKVYEELVRSRLNTRKLRESYVARGGQSKRPIKPPGTPLLTLDGRVIIDRPKAAGPAPAEPQPQKPSDEKPAAKDGRQREEIPAAPPSTSAVETPSKAVVDRRKEVIDAEIDATTIVTPIEELLDSGRTGESAPSVAEAQDQDIVHAQKPEKRESEEELDTDTAAVEATASADISFEDLFAGGTILEDLNQENTASAPGSQSPAPIEPREAEYDAASVAESEGPPPEPQETDLREEDALSAVDDLLRYEIEATFSDEEKATGVVQETAETVSDLPVPAAPEAKPDEGTDGTPLEKASVPFVEVEELLAYSDEVESPSENQLPVSPEGVAAGSSHTQTATVTSAPATHEEATRTGRLSTNGREQLINRVRTATSLRQVETTSPAGEPSDDEREKLLIAGLKHYKNQRFDDAIREFQAAIRKFPNFKEAHSILGNAYFRNRMFDEAAEAYRRVKELDPSDTTAYENMGVIFANRGQYMEAMKEWQSVLEIDPSRDDIRRKIELAARMMMKRQAS